MHSRDIRHSLARSSTVRSRHRSPTEETARASLYLLVTGASFFISYSAAQSNSFTRAQSDLAGSLGLAAGGIAALLGYAATDDADKGVRAIALGSAIVGTIAGVELGRSLSDAEAHAATLGMRAAAATALSVTTIAGASDRTSAAAVAIVGALGYPIGVRYPRRASYTVTAGDVEATSTAGTRRRSCRRVRAWAGSTARPEPRSPRYLGRDTSAGCSSAICCFARPFDLTQSQANIVNIGAIAGALVGVAVPVLARSDNPVLPLRRGATGAALGMAGLASSFPDVETPASTIRQRSSGARRKRPLRRSTRAAWRRRSAACAGNHVLARLTF